MKKSASEIIEVILEDLGIKAPTLATNIGLDYQRLYDIQRGKTKKISAEVANAVKSEYPEYNLSWLLTGEGEKFQKKLDKDRIDEIVNAAINDATSNYSITKMKTYPLIPIEAVAGYSADENGVTYEDCDQYAVPDFEAKGMEFLIRVSGSSMFPKYNNGDILACRKIADVLFFQWGRVYVIDSSQGQLVKRIYEDRENPDNIVCKSDNEEKYPPFSIPKNDIRSLSLVVGAIKLD